MGLNFALLNFLLHTETFQKSSESTDKRILEIGRLKNSMSKKQQKLISRKYSIPYEVVNSDPHVIYRYFGFNTINTLDVNNFEGADVIVNLNLIPEKNKYFDGLDELVKVHLFKLYDGSAMVNLLRFTSKTVVGLTKWSKKDNLDLAEFIFNSNQEIYRKKWNNDEIIVKSSFNHKVLRFFISLVYKSNFTLVKYFFARTILRLNERNYF